MSHPSRPQTVALAKEPSEPRRDLLSLGKRQLAEELSPWIDQSYRIQQLWSALHRRGAQRIADITELSLKLRARLEESFYIGRPTVAERQLSADGTCKYLIRLGDGATVEAVDIPDGDRRTLCLSSQAGCALACTFCVTGYWGAGRNLSAGEIVAQVRLIGESSKADPAAGPNIVMMGMGEPLLNPEPVREALDLLAENTSWRRMTLSTVGIVPEIDAMADWRRRPNLAISLHAPDDERRDRIMPINQTHPLAELMDCLKRYPLEKGRKITIEYLLIRDFNDHVRDADKLVRVLRGLPVKVNLIPINPDPVLGPEMVPPRSSTVDRFRHRLRQRGLVATVRKRRGDEVHGACGQLRAFGRPAHGVAARRENRAGDEESG